MTADAVLLPADDNLSAIFRNVESIIHAGDVGHHGGELEVLAGLESICHTLCVRGNTDSLAAQDKFPETRELNLLGWKIGIIHICGEPPAKVYLFLHKITG